MATRLHCPKCRAEFVRRSSIAGTAERLMGKVRLLPFRCQACGHRFRKFAPSFGDSKAERREFTRVPTRLPANFRGRDEQGQGVVTDLSIAGARLYTGTRIGSGELLQLTIQNPGDRGSLAVDVVVVVRNANPMRLGLAFIEMKPEEKRRLGELVQYRLGARLNPS